MPEFTVDEVLDATLGHTKSREKTGHSWGLPLIAGNQRRRTLLALVGPNFDGHDFAYEAAVKGAGGIVAS